MSQCSSSRLQTLSAANLASSEHLAIGTADFMAVPGSKLICYASLTIRSSGTIIVPIMVRLTQALGVNYFARFEPRIVARPASLASLV